jgi:hypothetical protein
VRHFLRRAGHGFLPEAWYPLWRRGRNRLHAAPFGRMMWPGGVACGRYRRGGDRTFRAAAACSRARSNDVAKGQEKKKQEKKEPAKTFKEKRAAKKDKKDPKKGI